MGQIGCADWLVTPKDNLGCHVFSLPAFAYKYIYIFFKRHFELIFHSMRKQQQQNEDRAMERATKPFFATCTHKTWCLIGRHSDMNTLFPMVRSNQNCVHVCSQKKTWRDLSTRLASAFLPLGTMCTNLIWRAILDVRYGNTRYILRIDVMGRCQKVLKFDFQSQFVCQKLSKLLIFFDKINF